MMHHIATKLRKAISKTVELGVTWLPALLALHLGGSSARADLLYAALANNTIVSYDTAASTPTPTTFATTGLINVTALAVDSAGNVYAADNDFTLPFGPQAIEKITRGGVSSVFAMVNGSIYPSRPTGLVFDATGNLYVTEFDTQAVNIGGIPHRDEIVKVPPSGSGAATVFTLLWGPAGSAGPSGLAFDKTGHLYVANTFNDFIDKITFGTPSTDAPFATSGGPSAFQGPTHLAFDTAGNLYASNSAIGTIQKFTPGGVGSLFATLPGGTSGDLAFDTGGNLFVVAGNTIEKITPGGVASVFATNVNGPVALAISPIPEPSALVLASLGILWFIGSSFRRDNKRRARSSS